MGRHRRLEGPLEGRGLQGGLQRGRPGGHEADRPEAVVLEAVVPEAVVPGEEALEEEALDAVVAQVEAPLGVAAVVVLALDPDFAMVADP